MAEIDDSMQEANKTVFEKANIDEDELCKELEALMTGAGHANVRADSKWGSRAKVPVGFLRSTDKANSFSSSSRATVTADRSQDGRALVGATANRSMSPHRRRVDTSTVQKRAESANKKRTEPPFYWACDSLLLLVWTTSLTTSVMYIIKLLSDSDKHRSVLDKDVRKWRVLRNGMKCIRLFSW